VVQIVLGLARAGSLLRFVSNAVLRGFLTGVAVNIVLSQLPNLTGYASGAGGRGSMPFSVENG
jgi:SulP family sulfate permease